jgi:hypothetical protein
LGVSSDGKGPPWIDFGWKAPTGIGAESARRRSWHWDPRQVRILPPRPRSTLLAFTVLRSGLSCVEGGKLQQKDNLFARPTAGPKQPRRNLTIKACGTHPRSAAHQRRQTPGHMSAVLPHPCNCNLPSVVCILLLPTPRLCHTAYPIRPSAEAAERRRA